MKYNVNREFLLNTSKEILSFNSPTGFCFEIIDKIEEMLKPYGYNFQRTNKGCAVITIPGESNERVVGLSAHVDTLGAMVRSITGSGTLRFTLLGGPIVPTLDGEYCTIRTREGKLYTGTFLSTSPAAHVFKDASTKKRDDENMEVRIDEVVSSKEDVQKLGIENGDYIAYDPKTVLCESGYIKSRFLDDKLSVCILMSLLESYKTNHIVPERGFYICISTYEEVGHGASYVPEEVKEFISVDMGCIGEDLSCTERDVSICAKDSGGPYDYDITTLMSNLAKENNIRHAIDIYPFYGSDTGAALKGGNNIKGGLIGPGVAHSHGMERSHIDGVIATFDLLRAYIDRK